MEPISRAKLQSLHAEELRRQRNEHIHKVVSCVYSRVCSVATSSSTEKNCTIRLQDIIRSTPVLQDISKDVVSQLEELFPDCKIEFSRGIYKDNRNRTGEFIPITGDTLPDGVQHIITVDWL